MNKSEVPSPKSPTSHLHAVNLVVALLAGVISITGGIYSLKTSFFSGPEYGSLQGTVRDEKIAKPLKLVSVEVADLAGAVVNTATTDDDGHYLIESLKTGNYVVKFTAPLHKVEAKTIKIEKNIWSSINVDLVPDMPPTSITPVESAAVVRQNIQVPYTPATSATPNYNTAESAASTTTAPSTYMQSGMQQDPTSGTSFSGTPPSGFHRRPPRRPSGPPGEYEQTSSTDSSFQGTALAQAGAQLLQALTSKKSESSSSTSSN